MKHHKQRLLGVQIAHGFSSEARVFAQLLAHRDDRYNALVLMHEGPGDEIDTGARFADAAHTSILRFDTGWRVAGPDGHSLRTKFSSAVRLRRTLPVLLAAARRFDPDVIYSNQQTWDCTVASYIAARLHRPQLIHLHYSVGPWLQPRGAFRLIAADPLRQLQRCATVVAVSDFIRSDAVAHAIDGRRVRTIRNAIVPFPPPSADDRASVLTELGLPATSTIVSMVARLEPSKAHRDAIAAFAQAAATRESIHLLLVGDGVLRAELERQVASLGLERQIHFTGRRADIPRILNASDIFLHPSRYEPCALAVLEAQAAGLPVVAYAEGGTVELVHDSVTGLLAPPGDIRALGSALAALADAPERAAVMGRAARCRIAKDFRPERAGIEFADLVQTVAASRR